MNDIKVCYNKEEFKNTDKLSFKEAVKEIIDFLKYSKEKDLNEITVKTHIKIVLNETKGIADKIGFKEEEQVE